MSKLNILAITACMSGVAHTYMAAERLIKLAKQECWTLKIETQGALGIENEILLSDINSSNIVVIVSNINIKNRDRFNNCRCIEMDISQFLLNNDILLSGLNRISKAPQNTILKL